MTELDRQYKIALKRIMNEGIEEYSQRTHHNTRSIPGLNFEIEAGNGFPLLSLRKVPIRIFVAEQVWFLTGSRRPEEFLSQFTRIWDDFTELSGVVTAAYGYRWRHFFGRDQILDLVNLLTKEPSSRHGVVVTWDPASDGLNPDRKRKNVPCPFTFVVNIIGGMLHMHNIVRSNDMILGFPHDTAGFALLQHLLAAKLGVGVGKYTHTISNAHVYDIHYQAAKTMLKRTSRQTKIELKLGKNSFDRALKGDQNLVIEIVSQLEKQYKPLAPIEGLQIVL